jgi:SAM-dependent methyltransferase
MRERRSRSYRSVDAGEAERLGRQARTLFPLERIALVEHGLAAGQTILDLGCGQGTFLGLVAEAFAGSRCIGLDRSARLLVAARQQRGVAEVVQCDLADRARLLAELERIGPQTVLCRFVLQHMTSQEREALLAALAEHSARLPLRVVLADVDSDSWFDEPPSPLLAEAREQLNALQARNGGDRRIGARLAELLREAGFSDIRSSRVRVDSALMGFPSFWAAFGQVLCAGLRSRPSAREALLEWSRDPGTAARWRAGFDVVYASASRTTPDE